MHFTLGKVEREKHRRLIGIIIAFLGYYWGKIFTQTILFKVGFRELFHGLRRGGTRKGNGTSMVDVIKKDLGRRK